ncbi:MAG: hypothetical protein ABR498_05250 [Candidatus Dormibacteria bacterium]
MSALRVVPVDAAALARRHAHRARIVWVGAAALLSLVLTVQPFSDSSAWWHLAMGRLITAHGLPSQEPFSFLPAAHAWTGATWLFDVLLAGLVGAGGTGLASMVFGIAATSGLLLAALSLQRTTSVSGPWLAIALVLSAVVASPYIGVSGASVSMLGVGAVLWVIARWRDGDTSVMWLLPPAFLLWANLDGGFVVGLLIAATTLFVTGRRGLSPGLARRQLAAALGVSVLATLVNPYGVSIYSAVIATASDPAVAQLSSAFASPDFHTMLARAFEIEAAVLVVCWIAAGAPDLVDATLAVAALAASLWSSQFITLFAVIALPQMARYSSHAWHRHVAPRMPMFRAPARPWQLLAASGAAFVLVAGVSVFTVRQLTPRAAAAFEDSTYPKAAADYVATHLAGKRLYSTNTWSDYLAYRFPSGRVVFLYDDGGAFTTTAVQSYSRMHLLQDGWEQVIRDDRIEHAVVSDTSQEASALHELGWQVDCYDSSSAAVVMSAPAGGTPAAASAPLTTPPSAAPRC